MDLRDMFSEEAMNIVEVELNRFGNIAANFMNFVAQEGENDDEECLGLDIQYEDFNGPFVRKEKNLFLEPVEVLDRDQDFFQSLASVRLVRFGQSEADYQVGEHERRFHLLAGEDVMTFRTGLVHRMLIPPLYDDDLDRASLERVQMIDNAKDLVTDICHGVRPVIRGVDAVCFGVVTPFDTHFFLWEGRSLFEVNTNRPFQAYKVDGVYHISTDIGEDFFLMRGNIHLKYKYRQWTLFTDKVFSLSREGLEMNVDFRERICRATRPMEVRVEGNKVYESQEVIKVLSEEDSKKDGVYRVDLGRNLIGDLSLSRWVRIGSMSMHDIAWDRQYLLMPVLKQYLDRSSVAYNTSRILYYFQDYKPWSQLSQLQAMEFLSQSQRDYQETIHAARLLKGFKNKRHDPPRHLYDLIYQFKQYMQRYIVGVSKGWFIFSESFYYYQMKDWMVNQGYYIRGQDVFNCNYCARWKQKGQDMKDKLRITSRPLGNSIGYRSVFLTFN